MWMNGLIKTSFSLGVLHNAAPIQQTIQVGSSVAGSANRHPVVAPGVLPAALRVNAQGVDQNRSRRFCRGINTSL